MGINTCIIMEEIYLKALVARVQNEPELLDRLPEDVRAEVLKLLNEMEVQDVVLLNKSVINTQTFTANKPYLVYDTVYIPKGNTLTIDPGAHLYFHNNARLFVG